jgi:hypothetical protein
MDTTFYPLYIFSTGKFTFMKILNRFEFEWINFEAENDNLSLTRGKVRTHFAQNISAMLRYEHHMRIDEALWQKMENLYHETA